MGVEALPDPLPIRCLGPEGRVAARVRPPGSRSITNRALLVAGLAHGESLLLGAGESEDSAAMRAGLRALGVQILESAEGFRVRGCNGRLAAPRAPVDVGASGTTARFLTAAATLAAGPVVIDGAPRMRERPIRELVECLRALGATARIDGAMGCPPVSVAGGGLPGGWARIDARRSSQYVSAVLLAAPCAATDVHLELAGGQLVSRPFVELTLEVMSAFGAEAGWKQDGSLHVKSGRRYQARHYAVEPDSQSAIYPCVAAALTGGRVVVEGIPAGSRQTELRALEVLEAMGCLVKREPDALVLEGPARGLRGVDADMNATPDAVLAVAVAALFAKGPTHLRNIANLRIKETDRLAALECELRRLGARATADADSLRIEPGHLGGALIETYDDHRMAMSFALAGLRIPGIAIRNPACVAKTWPDFFGCLAQW